MANRFHKLKNNDSDFPYLGNVDVYDYDNDFDYSRYIPTQMNITMCSVPWDMGEAHIGARTISGIGNVVYFGSAKERDAWFAQIPDSECYRFETKYKELHRSLEIDVPVPFDVCSKFNYIAVEYSLFANDESPVLYEHDGGVRRWFWFVREVEFIAANTTRLHLLDDAFQTWIYDIDVTGMILERGHAPMFDMRADKYLQKPYEYCTNLLTEDVNFGQASIVKHIDALTLNAGNMYACIATTANPTHEWGSKQDDNWRVPASASYTVNGVPSVYVFALETGDLSSFLLSITADVPQFKQTIQCVFFASSDLLDISSSFTFANTTCYRVNTSRKRFDLVRLKKDLFGYDEKYSDIAKLYTFPYAFIEVSDENGNVDSVKIEDSTGEIDVIAALSIAYPALTIDAYLTGTGGNAGVTVTYRNVDSHTFSVNGAWYDTLRSWDVPTFAVVLDARYEYDYATYYDRKQRVNDYTTAYDNTAANALMVKANADASANTVKANADASANTAKANADSSALTTKSNTDALANTAKDNADAIAATVKSNSDYSASNVKTNSDTSADTAKVNADASAETSKTNADRDADTVVENSATQIDANYAIQSSSAAAASQDTVLTNLLAQGLQAWESGYARDTVNNQVNAAYASAAIGAAGGTIGSAVSGAMAGASAGPAGAIAGAVGGLVGGAISGATSIAQTAIAANLTSAQAEASISLSQSKVDSTNTNNSERTANQNSANFNNTDITCDTIETTSANSAATMKSNASDTSATEKANALRTQTTDKANNARTYATDTANNARTYATDLANNVRTANTALASNMRTYDTNTANNARTQATALANNERTQATALANNERLYNTTIANANREKTRAQNDLANDIAQAGLREPFIYGNFANGSGATSKPIALFAHVVTQSKAAISAAGDEFLRYGYQLDRQWDFDGQWNIGKYFTYWKLRDFWVSNLNVPDMYMDKIRFFLFGGVTIWCRPEYIGKKSIYENFNE